eukprot:127446-Pleurochrysis_carterae.AAC.1
MGASAVALSSCSLSRAVSRSALFTSARRVAVAPCAASRLSSNAVGAPPTPDATAVACPSPVAA